MAVGVSELANYAADPVGFCRRRGGVRNRKAVAVGNRRHYEAGISPLAKLIRFIVGLIVIGGLVMLGYFFLSERVNAGFLGDLEAGRYDTVIWILVGLFLIWLAAGQVRRVFGRQGHLAAKFRIPRGYTLVGSDLGGEKGVTLKARGVIGQPDALFRKKLKWFVVGELKGRKARGRWRWHEFYQVIIYMALVAARWKGANVDGRLCYTDGVVRVRWDPGLAEKLFELASELEKAKKTWTPGDPRPLHAR